MLKKANVLAICAVLSIAVMGSVGATAQEGPALKPYNEAKVTFPGLQDSWGVTAWQITGNKTSILYLIEFDYDVYRARLIRYKFFANGKAASPITILNAEDIWEGRLVWFDSTGSPGKSPAGATAGLLFVAYMPGGGSKKMVIAVAEVDKDGKPIGAFRTLLERTPSEAEPIFLVSLGAGLGPESVSLVVGFLYFHYGEDYTGFGPCKAYLLETDFNGLQLGGLTEIPMPGGGKMNLCFLFSPYWTGSGWMMAATNTKQKLVYENEYKYYYTKPIANELYIYTTKGGAGAPAMKFRKRLLYKDNQQDEIWTFRQTYFFEPEAEALSGAKKAKRMLIFFFSHRNYIPYNQVKMDRYTADYYFCNLNPRGKRVGSAVKSRIEHWEHKMPYDPDKELFSYYNALSNLVPSGDGQFYASQHRSALLGEGTYDNYVYDCEHELRLYKIDPVTGAAELIAEKAAGSPTGTYQHSILRWFGKKLAVINYISVRVPDYSYQYNYATITP